MNVTILTYTPADPDTNIPMAVGGGEYILVLADTVKMRSSLLCDECGTLDADTEGHLVGCSACSSDYK